MEVFETQERPTSWKTRLESMVVGGEMPVALKNSTTVRQCISRLKELSALDFSTKKEGDIVIVKRLA